MSEKASSSTELQFKRILFAVEDSEGANGALPTVIGLARLFGSQVLVVHLREHAALGRKRRPSPKRLAWASMSPCASATAGSARSSMFTARPPTRSATSYWLPLATSRAI